MAVTLVAAVRVRMRRELEPLELALATELLDAAEARLRSRVADVDARLDEDPVFRTNFCNVAADAVVRVLVNPEGYRQESVGPYGWTYDTRVAAGFLTILEDEWALLSPTGGAFTIAPSLPAPTMPAAQSEWNITHPLTPYGGTGYWGNLS